MRRVGDLKGPGARVAEILAELFPVVDLERVPGELLLLGGTQLGWGSSLLTAAAAQFTTIQVFNPVDSGKLITVTSALIATTVDQIVQWSNQETALPTIIGNERIRDTRRPFGSRSAGQIRHESSVAATPAVGRARVLADTTLTLNDENGLSVLSPGHGFNIGATTANSNLIVSFNWRERVAEPSELNI